MTTVPAALAATAVLASAGLAPTAALIGPRLIVVPLMPLTGAVIAALAATFFMAVGGSFLGWFVGLAAAGTLAAIGACVLSPGWRPRVDPAGGDTLGGLRRLGPRLTGVVGALAVLGSCIWCLRGLATPTVGFDARAVWLTRAGWLLQSHHQLLADMRVRDVVLVQSVYPPLVSAATAVAWRVTGDDSMRLGVVVIAVLNTCALAVAAFALVEAGRRVAVRSASSDGEAGAPTTAGLPVPLAPMVVGVVTAVLLVFVAFGITEPFMTNGYADPIWSLAAVGAIAYGLQLGTGRVDQGAALILVLVAGMSKNEGVVTAAGLIVLIAFRGLVGMPAAERRRRWWRPLLLGLAELAVIAAWPIVMRVIHARGLSSSNSPVNAWPDRARVTYDAMAPYLHVLVLAAPLAVVGGLALSSVRRRSGVANDGWAWAGLAWGLLAIGGAFVTGAAAIHVWLVGTVHRVTEFPALAGWWIVALWVVVASGAVSATRHQAGHRSTGAPPGAVPEFEPTVDRVGSSVPVATP